MKYSIFLIIICFLFQTNAQGQNEENYLGVNGLKVKNNIAYFDFSCEIKAEKTCLAKLDWDDKIFEDKREEDYNNILHPVSRFDKKYFVWS